MPFPPGLQEAWLDSTAVVSHSDSQMRRRIFDLSLDAEFVDLTRIGAEMKLWSRLNSGTEIELIVPHDVLPCFLSPTWTARAVAPFG